MWVEAISERSKVSVDALWRIARSASNRYFEFNIKKADGSDRLIQHPSRPLKALQRLINRNLVAKAAVHPNATAYTKGSKILLNAERHLGTSYTTRLDFENFFPSFDSKSVSTFFRELSHRESLGLDESDIDFVTRISCRNGRLVIGAPSSPKISNAMMYDFDNSVSELAERQNVIYSRYADDIFISSFKKDILADFEKIIRDIVIKHDVPPLKISEKKTLYLSKAGHRSITGLVITTEGKTSLGRKRKREIKSLTYLSLNGKLPKSKLQYLSGLLSFAYDNEPEFIGNLSRKFEKDIVAWFKAGCQ